VVGRAAGGAGVFVISITPFARDGGLDEGGLRSHLRRMAAGGVGVYLGGGGSGEGYTLDRDELRRVLEIGVEELGGRHPVRAMGVEPRTAAEMIDFVRLAAGCGVDAVQVYSLEPGHGHRPTPEEVRRYFRTVLEECGDVPAVLSTHQSVGYQLAPTLLAELVGDFPNVVGVNCSQPELAYLDAVLRTVAGRAEVHVGGPVQALSALALGARGYLSSEANLAPRLCAAVVGTGGPDLDAYARVVRLSFALYGHGGIRATKAVLNRLGLPGGWPRAPQLPLEGPELEAVLAVVGELGVPAAEGW
jgi:4-hydroxy-tetrahydrodipicolinate synthase